MHLVGFMKVVGGSASVPLARGIAKEVRAGFVDVAFEKHPGGFPDGEQYVRLLGSVASEHVVLVQTTHPDPMLVEFLLLADAIRDEGARRIAKEASAVAGVPFDFLVKERIDSYTVKIEPKALAVKGKSVGIVDDVISTGGTIATAAQELRAQGARRVIAACVHGLFVGKAEANLKAVDEVIATDTVQSPHTRVSVAPEFAAAIRALGWVST